jgi:hypothetical protein
MCWAGPKQREPLVRMRRATLTSLENHRQAYQPCCRGGVHNTSSGSAPFAADSPVTGKGSRFDLSRIRSVPFSSTQNGGNAFDPVILLRHLTWRNSPRWLPRPAANERGREAAEGSIDQGDGAMSHNLNASSEVASKALSSDV